MGISVTKLLIILAIIIVVFGTKRLRNLGGDLGDAIKGFRSAIKDGEKDHQKEDEEEKITEDEGAKTIEGEIISTTKEKT
jgi:sec-independent protein translocase protein TatA